MCLVQDASSPFRDHPPAGFEKAKAKNFARLFFSSDKLMNHHPTTPLDTERKQLEQVIWKPDRLTPNVHKPPVGLGFAPALAWLPGKGRQGAGLKGAIQETPQTHMPRYLQEFETTSERNRPMNSNSKRASGLDI